jgi:hypothetical protein
VAESLGRIFVVSPRPPPAIADVTYVPDHEALDVDVSRLRYRPTWVRQQLIKLCQEFTASDRYLVVDSDVFFNRPLGFTDEGRTVLYTYNWNYHPPYFRFLERVLGGKKVAAECLICEAMVFEKAKVSAILARAGLDRRRFVERCYGGVDEACYPSEYEAYGHRCLALYPDEFVVRRLAARDGGRAGGLYTGEEVRQYVASMRGAPVDLFTLHTWT